MEQVRPEFSSPCRATDISAYLDGELSAHDELGLEMHLAGCGECRQELNLQKNILLALESSLEAGGGPELPEGFTRAVVANAESRVSGLRRADELVNAALICSVLFLAAVIILGSDAGHVMAVAGSLLDRAYAVAGAAMHFVYDVALAVAVIFRALFSSLIFGSAGSAAALCVIFTAALIAFSRLLLGRGRA